MSIDIYPEASIIINAVSVAFLGWQIHSNKQLNRNNKTFEMISQLDNIMNGKVNKGSRLVEEINLIDDFSGAISDKKARKIVKSKAKRKIVYEILNFYESLAVAVFSKNVNKKILQRMSGYRILNAYKKLKPFILCIRDEYEEPKSKPYQHFEQLYIKWSASKKFKPAEVRKCPLKSFFRNLKRKEQIQSSHSK